MHIVIVNYRTGGLVIECLRSLASQVAGGRARVIVVDNDSGDNSVERIGAAIAAAGWTSWAEVLPAPRNGGFAYGNNVGIRAGLASAKPPDCVWLLNPDTRVEPGALATLIEFLKGHPAAGIVGSGLEGPDGAPECSAHQRPSLLSEFDSGARIGFVSRRLRRHVVSPPAPTAAQRCHWVSGASLVVRRAVFEGIGLMDDGYFLYFEEVDFCARARRAGWEIWCVPAARVMHLEAAATGIQDQRRRPAYWFASRRRYFVQNHGRMYAALADLARLTGTGVGRACRLVAGRPQYDPPHFCGDLVRHSLGLGS